MKKKTLLALFCILVAALMLSGCGAGKGTFSDLLAKLRGEETITKVEKEEQEEEPKEEPKEEEPEEIDIQETKPDDDVIPGSSQTDAYLVPLNTKVFGTVRGGEYAWFAFTTGEEAGAIYRMSFVNETTGSHDLMGHLFDEYGTELEKSTYYAENDGVPKTIESSSLEPNTTYYVRLESTWDDEDLDYSFIVKNPADKQTAYKTLGTFSDAVGAVVKDGDTVTAGTNINDALLLPLGAKVHGTAPGGQSAWFSFTTGEKEGATYNVTFVNDTPNSRDLMGHLYDEYGIELEASTYYAENDGTPKTITSTALEPDTTYYVEIFPTWDDEDIDYSVMVKSPDAVKEESKLVFETPFEINDTQVQFVAEKAVFIDEAQAKEVLKPVAEAILEHPDRSVLLAGTTATDGDQAARVQLSNKRAEAVKKLLVTVYKVPESQIKTVGLGFEADPFERGRDRDANGNFVESEGRKNRRVVVLDTEDPVAQEILKR